MSTSASASGAPLKGRRVVITGGVTGIGFGIAQAIVQAGAEVLITGRRDDRVTKAVDSLNTIGEGRAFGITADVSKGADNVRVIAAAVRHLGGIDALINNAGTGAHKPIAEVTDDDLRAVFEVNFFGLYSITQLALPEIMKSTAGRVINISSGASIRGTPYSSVYSASKGAVNSFTRSLAVELAADERSRHVTVNTILPGPFASELLDSVPIEIVNGLIAKVPLKRKGDPRADVGGFVATLIGPAGAFITGQDLAVDGGLTASA